MLQQPQSATAMPTRQIRPGALGLLTPPQRGLALAIIQADRCGRGGDDLEDLAKPNRFAHMDTTTSAQLSQRIGILSPGRRRMGLYRRTGGRGRNGRVFRLGRHSQPPSPEVYLKSSLEMIDRPVSSVY